MMLDWQLQSWHWLLRSMY
jgi:hypothetical protein